MTVCRWFLPIVLATIALCLPGTASADVRFWHPYDKDAGTAALWHFDGVADDSAGGLKEVQIRGKVSFVEGRFGKALQVDSEDGAVAGTLSEALAPPRDDDGTLSMEAWVYLDEAPTQQAFIVQLLPAAVKFDRRHEVDPQWKGYALAVNPDRSVTLGYLIAGNRVMGRKAVRVTSPKAVLPPGRWVHVAGSVKGMVKRIHIDGKAVLSIDYTNTSPENMVLELPEGTPVTVGNSVDGTRRFAGRLDEVRVTTDRLHWFEKPQNPWAGRPRPEPLEAGTMPPEKDVALRMTFDDGDVPGVFGKGLKATGQTLKVPFNPDGGAVEFCFRPGTWDNVNGYRKKVVTLVDWGFRIQATRGALRVYRYWKAGQDNPFSSATLGEVEIGPDRWHHLVVNWRRVGQERYRIKLYVDGRGGGVYRQERLKGVARSPIFDVVMKLDETDEFKLSMPDGTIDELIVYKRPLNDDEARNAWRRYTDPAKVAKTGPLRMETFYYPGLNRLLATVIRHSPPPVRDGDEVSLSVRAPKSAAGRIGRAVGTTQPDGSAELRLDLPDAAPGTWTVSAHVVQKESDPLLRGISEPLPRPELPWNGFRGGISEEVLPGFQPLEQARGVVKGYKKQVAFGGCGMIGSIRVYDTELLAGPIRLKGAVGGKPFAVMPKLGRANIVESTPAKVHLKGASAAAPVDCIMDTTMEYDGCIRFELTMKPAAGQSVKLDELYLEIPMRTEAATHMHVSGSPMRNTFYAGRIPAGPGAVWEPYVHSPRTWRFNTPPEPGDGVVWASTDLVNARRGPVGSLTTPFVWLGNLDMGLTWFADSDEGWWPTDKRPALEVNRNGKTVKLRVNFAGEAVDLTGTRKIVWGLFVNPGKKLTYPARRSGWAFAYLQQSGRFTQPSPRGVEFARVYPDDPARCRGYVEALHRRDLDATPYIESSPMDFFAEDWAYYRNEWSGDGSVHGADSAVDYAIYWLDKWQKDCLIDGVYIDNTFVRLGFNPVSKSAYHLPDGRIQGGFDLWNQRAYYKRLRTTLVENRGRSHVTLHMTACLIPPCFVWADSMLAGEIGGVSGKTADFMDYWPLDQIAVLWNGRLWGVPVRSLKKIFDVGYKDQAALEKAFRTRTAAMMLVGAVDAVTDHRLRKFGEMYHYEKQLPGIWDDPQAFIPFWHDDILASRTGGIHAAGWRYKDKLLVIVSNYNRKPVEGAVDVNTVEGMKKVGPLVKTRDLERPDAPVKWQDNRLKLTVPARDYRFVLFE